MNNILLVGAAAMLLVSLALAWAATFCRLIRFEPVASLFKDYGALVRSHIDLLMMATLCLALYALRVPLPPAACWLVVIGGFTNPALFFLRAVDPTPTPGPLRKAFRLASFLTTTIGFGWSAVSILQAAG